MGDYMLRKFHGIKIDKIAVIIKKNNNERSTI